MQSATFLELYGVSRGIVATRTHANELDVASLLHSFKQRVDNVERVYDVVADPLLRATTTLHRSDADVRWFGDWLWQLERDALRAVVRGLLLVQSSSSSSSSIVVGRVAWRDELVQLLLHAGYSPTFLQQRTNHDDDGDDVWWLVSFDACDSIAETPIHISSSSSPSSSSSLDRVHELMYDGRTWCFDMSSDGQTNDGFVVVRRARRDARRDARNVVTHASRATIQGSTSHVSY